MQDAAVHVHSAAAKPRILRALPGVLSDARLASGADCATAERSIASADRSPEKNEARSARIVPRPSLQAGGSGIPRGS